MERKLKNINFLSILKPLICFTNDHIILVCILQTTPFCLKQCRAVLAILWFNLLLAKENYRMPGPAPVLPVSDQQSELRTSFDKWYFYGRLACSHSGLWSFSDFTPAAPQASQPSHLRRRWRNKRKWSSIIPSSTGLDKKIYIWHWMTLSNYMFIWEARWRELVSPENRNLIKCAIRTLLI